jgi:hypothetical protein
VPATQRTPAAKALKAWIDENSSQTALGNALDVKQPSVFAWLKGQARPEPALRAAIEEITGIPATDWENKSERTKRLKREKALATFRETKGAA